MQKSTASPSAAVQSTGNDCVASQPNDIKQTAAQTHTLTCGRAGCPVVIVYDVGTDWPTVNCLVNDHSQVCKGGLYVLANSPPRSDEHDPQYALSPPQPVPESSGANNGNRDNEVIAGSGQRRKKEDQRKQELENDEYTEDVQPTSVRCRGCQKAISLDKRSRYYPGLWVKHRGKCPGILKLETDRELTRRRDWSFPLNPELRPQAASLFDASGENWEEGESEDDEDEDGDGIQQKEVKGDGRTDKRVGVEDNDPLCTINVKRGIMIDMDITGFECSEGAGTTRTGMRCPAIYHDMVIQQPTLGPNALTSLFLYWTKRQPLISSINRRQSTFWSNSGCVVFEICGHGANLTDSSSKLHGLVVAVARSTLER
ncbi:uncharacterized protein BJ212DRAFT_1302098 [Suillus subaureus]|uniref:Uncharacterized protein n=1 Tax=Suillus subaureus TaxID=48587 RepID=A0A9P7E5D7_9AGAM|nr:uncharacterized protein BJ212DRAFT_1302098 [Suillus subaureus]KAG1811212.1 hypothetical protein BJ212DRAFT_1302098 [Suillus subaureus]